jgi:methyl-accepting chemotaxis protein
VTRPQPRDLFATTLLHVGVLDITSTVMLASILVGLLGLVDWQVYAALAVVRQTTLVARLHGATAPIRQWQNHVDHEAQRLAAALEAVDAMLRRVITTSVIGWAAMLGAIMVLPRLGLLTSRDIGGPELLFGVLITIATVMAMVPLLGQVLERVLLDVRMQLGAARLERRIAAPPTSTSLARQLVFVNVATSTAIVIGLTATTMYERAHRLRVEALSEQRDRVALAATQLREGLLREGEVVAGLEVVGVAELPETLVIDPADPPAPSETVATMDVRRELAVAAAPVGDGRWVLARVEVEQQLGWVTLLFVLFVGGCVFVGLFVGAALHRVLTTPLARLDAATRGVAERGDIRGVGRIIPLRNDELGALADNFNNMLDTLDELAVAAAAVAEGDLRVEIHGPGELPDALRGMLARLHEVVEQIQSTSLELAAAAAEIHTITRQQEHAAELQSQRVLAVRQTISTLAATAEDISERSTEVLANAEHTLATTDAMIEKINLLGAQAGNIRTLLQLIHDVADRSDLLALNGSLEATRAGEAGRGFALVAAEMRRLAERVTGTVADVRDRISAIETAGTSTVQATADSRRLADGTATAARSISTVTRRQSEETEQVSHKVSEVAEGMLATVEAARQTLAASDGLRVRAAELERLTRRFQTKSSHSA